MLYFRLVTWKLFIAAASFAMAFSASLLPTYSTNARVISILSTLTAGVFLAAAFAHLLPDSIDDLQPAIESSQLPLAEILCGFGLLFTFVCERAVASVPTGEVAQVTQAIPAFAARDDEEVFRRRAARRTAVNKSMDHAAGRRPLGAGGALIPDDRASFTGAAQRTYGATDVARVDPMSGGEVAMSFHADASTVPMVVDYRADFADHQQDHHGDDHADKPHDPSAGGGHGHSHGIPPGTTPVTAVVMLLALSFHSLMEGVAIGLSDNAAVLSGLAVALLAHKALAAVALGTFMYAPIRAHDAIDDAHMHLRDTADHSMAGHIAHRKSLRSKYYGRMFLFAIMTPLGVILAVTVGSLLPDAFQGGIQAFAAGTFVYISLIEVLVREMTNQDLVPKTAALLFGYTAMSALARWT